MRLHKIGLWVLLFPIFASSLRSQATLNRQELDSARLFVQRFYDWYVPLTNKENKEPSSDIAIRIKPALFSARLLAALREDSAAAAKSPGYIVGIDFDPFLNSQDPEEHYKVGKIDRRDGSCWVEIYGIRNGIQPPAPDVTAEIARSNNTWKFVNFHYSDNSDLLGVLKQLKIDREKEKQ